MKTRFIASDGLVYPHHILLPFNCPGSQALPSTETSILPPSHYLRTIQPSPSPHLAPIPSQLSSLVSPIHTTTHTHAHTRAPIIQHKQASPSSQARNPGLGPHSDLLQFRQFHHLLRSHNKTPIPRIQRPASPQPNLPVPVPDATQSWRPRLPLLVPIGTQTSNPYSLFLNNRSLHQSSRNSHTLLLEPPQHHTPKLAKGRKTDAENEKRRSLEWAAWTPALGRQSVNVSVVYRCRAVALTEEKRWARWRGRGGVAKGAMGGGRRARRERSP